MPADEDEDVESHILAVHLGHAANCSSVGSVVDFLFVSAAAGAALMAAVAATLGEAESKRGREEEEQGDSPADADGVPERGNATEDSRVE